jgi:hypothetical protein
VTAPTFTYSGNVYTAAAAGSTDFALTSTTGNPIAYLEAAHIHVYKSANQGSTWTELIRPSQWDFASGGTVARLGTGIASGDWIKVQRITPTVFPYVTFQSSALLTAEQLNNDTLFNVYVNQETLDRSDNSVADSTNAIIAATAALSLATALDDTALLRDGSVPMEAPFDLGGHKAINAIAPTADTDLATKQYVDLRSGTSGPPGYTNWSYTATGGETALGSTGLGGGVLEYQVGKELVFLNGVLLLRGDDYTAEDGASITLALALAQGDHVNVRCVNYLPSNPGASYSYMRWRKTAAGGETAVGPTGDLSTSGYTLTLTYVVNREQVYLNGALLARGGDYAASTGATITGLAALASGDVIEVHSINTI